MPINFHIGASEQADVWLGQQAWPSMGKDLWAALGGAMIFFNNGRVMANVIYSGALDKFPKLKFVSVESGIGWVPFLLESLDYQLDEIAEGRKFDLRPSEYFQRNFYACFWFEKKDISHTIRQVGVDNCLFETDFPHPTGLYPIENIEGRLSGLTEQERAKVLSANAAKLYKISVN
jgi:predicted TIM-barrel fold metal-dependent hydrolase